MSQFTALFSSGFELSPFVTSSGLLNKSWNAIISSSSQAVTVTRGVGLSWKVHKEPDSDLTIIAFEATPVSTLQLGLVPSSELREKKFLHFEFLCTKKSPNFSVNRAAIDLFKENHQMLDQLKSQITSSTPLIVTGQGLGGSIAILFNLSLLDSIGTRKNRPLCITFGSPLIGDKKLQHAISRSSTWNSCFLQVVSHKDPLPTLFIKNNAGDYMPFGTFLFCSDANSTCLENPDSILELLKVIASIQDQNQGSQPSHYGNIVKNLYDRAICKDLTAHGVDLTHSNSLHACISLQLWALGLTPNMQIWQQQQQKNTALVTILEKQEDKFTFHKRTSFDPTKKLNVVKIDMAQLEWYKKDSKKQNVGYYDRYKKMSSTPDLDVVKFHKNLTNYWIKMVEEAEMKPQKEGASFRTRWLFAGTNYRRMVEPLDIAEYYTNGHKDYLSKRSWHYQVLEEWLNDEKAATTGSNTKNVESILTFDSCFWAHVEEAILSSKQVKDVQSSVAQKEEAKKKLLEFQEYVYGLLKKYEVSSEIFLKGSSYMTWWNDYKEISGVQYHSELATFMSNADNYNAHNGLYVKGTYNFS